MQEDMAGGGGGGACQIELAGVGGPLAGSPPRLPKYTPGHGCRSGVGRGQSAELPM